MSILTWLGIAFTAFVTVDLILYLRRGQIKKDFAALRTLNRWRWLLAIPVVLALIFVTVSVGTVLYSYGGPFLQFSWLQLLARPEEKATAGKNLVTVGFQIPIFVWIFLPLLAINIPRLAKREERAFRQDTRGVPLAIVRSLKFGLWHCIVGVPVAYGFALAIPGLWFAYQYSKGGVRLATAWHSIYNWVILAIAATLIAMGAV